MTTDPHTYEGEHNTLTISPTSDPGVVDVDLVNRAKRRGFWMEVPVGKLRSMIAASTTTPADDMDGGVAAALIEKEAEPDEGAHIGPEGEVDWRGLYLSENRRAEKAEKERDDALRLAKTAADQVDDALGMVARGECHDCIRDAAVIREPLSPDAIDNAMTDRMLNEAAAMRAARIQIKIDRLDAIRLLTAALTEPPKRPEGAKEIEAVLRDEWTFSDEDGGEEAFADLAQRLASRGVRVVTEEQS